MMMMMMMMMVMVMMMMMMMMMMMSTTRMMMMMLMMMMLMVMMGTMKVEVHIPADKLLEAHPECLVQRPVDDWVDSTVCVHQIDGREVDRVVPVWELITSKNNRNLKLKAVMK